MQKLPPKRTYFRKSPTTEHWEKYLPCQMYSTSSKWRCGNHRRGRTKEGLLKQVCYESDTLKYPKYFTWKTNTLPQKISYCTKIINLISASHNIAIYVFVFYSTYIFCIYHKFSQLTIYIYRGRDRELIKRDPYR